MLNQQRLDTAEVISDEIEEYCEAIEGFNNDAKERSATQLWKGWHER